MSRAYCVVLTVWLSLVSVVAVVAWRGNGEPVAMPATQPVRLDRLAVDQLTVHRIDVVEPDGKPRLIVSNAARYPGAIYGGREYPHKDRLQSGGLLFYNGDGTEAGGMVYDSTSTEATGMLTFDQRNQNESMKLVYGESEGRRRAGLMIFGDHPNQSFESVYVAQAAVAAARTEPERAALQQRLDNLRETMPTDPGMRVFVGRKGDESVIVLGDRHGAPRIMLEVDAHDRAHLDFLDAGGKVVRRYGEP